MYKVINLTNSLISVGSDSFYPNEETTLTDNSFRQYREEFFTEVTNGRLNILGLSNVSANFDFKNSNKTVGIFVENYNNYSGGRYYTWFLSYALNLLNYNVVIISSQFPVFVRDFIDYSKKNIKYCISSDLEYRCKLDFVIGVPTSGIIKASEYSQGRNIPLIGILFETPNFNSKYHNEQDSTERYWNSYKRHFTKCNYILTISELSKKYICEWLDFSSNKVLLLPPCINSIVADKVKVPDKENQIICIGRNVGFKGFDDLKYLVDKLNVKIKLITNSKEQVFYKNIEVLRNITDEQKFLEIKKSKLLVHPSKFEGFGLTLGESIYCDTLAIGYDLEVYKDFYGSSIKYAKDLDHLTYLVKTSLNEGYKCPENVSQKLSFEHFTINVSSIFTLIDSTHTIPIKKEEKIILPKVTIGIICLNEEEYIESCLKSIYDWDCCYEIFIIEGSTELYREANPRMVNKYGSSIDSTCDIIKNFPDLKRKINFIGGSWKDKFEMRSQYMNKATGDYIFLIDADEFYKKEDLRKLKQILIENPNIEELKITQRIFWHRFDLVLSGSFKNLCMERFWKNKNLKLVTHAHVIHNTDRVLKSIDTDIICYHYSNIRKNIDYVKAKVKFYELRDTTLYKGHYKDHVEYNKSWFNWDESITTLPRGVIITPYDINDHPDVIKKHPYYKEYEKNLLSNRKLRVLVIYHSTSTFYSGGQYAIWRYLEGLALNNVDVTVFCTGKPHYANENIPINIILGDFHRSSVNTKDYPDLILSEINKSSVGSNYDIVLGVCTSYNLPVVRYAKQIGKPSVQVIFENPYSLIKYAGESITKWVTTPDFDNYRFGILEGKYLVSVSDSSKIWMTKWIPEVRPENIKVIYPPINDLVADKVLNREIKRNNDIVTVGYWEGKKSTGILVGKVCSDLNIPFHIVSQYDMTPSYRKYERPILENNPNSKIYNLLSEEEKFELYAKCLICVNPYVTGGGDYQMKEAAYMGTLGLSFNIPPFIECNGGFNDVIPESIFYEYTRCTTKQLDFDNYLLYRLKERIQWLLENPEYIKFKVKYHKDYINKNHTTKVIGKKLKDYLEDIINDTCE